MHQSRGQNMVEFALTLPLCLVLLLACLDAGRLLGAYVALKNVAREGARYASLNAGMVTIAEIQDRAIAEAYASGYSGLTRSHVEVLAPSGWSDGRSVTVRVSYPVNIFTLTPFGNRTIVLRTSAEMVIIRGD